MIDIGVDHKTAQRIRKRPGSFDKFDDFCGDETRYMCGRGPLCEIHEPTLTPTLPSTGQCALYAGRQYSVIYQEVGGKTDDSAVNIRRPSCACPAILLPGRKYCIAIRSSGVAPRAGRTDAAVLLVPATRGALSAVRPRARYGIPKSTESGARFALPG